MNGVSPDVSGGSYLVLESMEIEMFSESVISLMLDKVGEDLEEELDDREIVSVHSSNSGGRGGGDGGLLPFCPPI